MKPNTPPSHQVLSHSEVFFWHLQTKHEMETLVVFQDLLEILKKIQLYDRHQKGETPTHIAHTPHPHGHVQLCMGKKMHQELQLQMKVISKSCIKYACQQTQILHQHVEMTNLWMRINNHT